MLRLVFPGAKTAASVGAEAAVGARMPRPFPSSPAHVRKQYSFTISSSISCDDLRDLLSDCNIRGVQVVLT